MHGRHAILCQFLLEIKTQVPVMLCCLVPSIQINSAVEFMAYSRNELLDTKQSVLENNSKFNSSTRNPIKQAGISTKAPTPRGTRA